MPSPSHLPGRTHPWSPSCPSRPETRGSPIGARPSLSGCLPSDQAQDTSSSSRFTSPATSSRRWEGSCWRLVEAHTGIEAPFSCRAWGVHCRSPGGRCFSLAGRLLRGPRPHRCAGSGGHPPPGQGAGRDSPGSRSHRRRARPIWGGLGGEVSPSTWDGVDCHGCPCA